MQKLNKIREFGVKVHRHGCLVDDFRGICADHGDAEHFVGIGISHHPDDTARVANGARARHE